MENNLAKSSKNSQKTEQICLAAGCFWGVQAYFNQLPGVVSSQVGYTGGHLQNPTYEQVCQTNTNHAEALLITYQPDQISFSDLLKHFWRMHSPTTFNRQGNDVGSQYRSAIFYSTEAQKTEAEKQKAELQTKLGQKVFTQIEPLAEFYPAEEYHQDYLLKNPGGYCHIDLNLAREPLA